MKRKDITTLVIIAAVASVFSFLLSGVLITSPKNRREQVPVVKPITSNFQLPDKKYFNSESIDPTQLIQIGNSSNKQPFSQ